jgi:hypothetical protein
VAVEFAFGELLSHFGQNAVSVEYVQKARRSTIAYDASRVQRNWSVSERHLCTQSCFWCRTAKQDFVLGVRRRLKEESRSEVRAFEKRDINYKSSVLKTIATIAGSHITTRAVSVPPPPHADPFPSGLSK